MRPVLLELEGFSGFRDRTEVDFTETDLVAFVGPTGSGKSSIIDGITFALFGSVPRYDDEKLVQPVIHQLATEARIRLDFEVDGARYRAVRVVRRTKGSATTRAGATTKEARLERADGGDDILAGAAREMRPAVEQLLGLTFEQFTKTVVLPQGEFAAFLHDAPSKRQALLRKLLDMEVYSRMAKVANARAAKMRTQVETLADQLERSADLSREGLEELRARAAEVRTAQAAAAEIVERHAEITRSLDAHEVRLRELTDVLGALGKIVMPDGIVELDEELAGARKELEGSQGAAGAARERLDEAVTASGEGPDAAVCRQLRDQREALVRLEAELPPLAEAEQATGAAAATARTELDAARRSEKAAAEALARAERLAGAGALVAALEVGAECPVCRQEVTRLPDHDPDEELQVARVEHSSRTAASVAAQESIDAARDQHVRAGAALESARTKLAEVTVGLEAAPSVEELRSQIEAAEQLAAARSAAETAARAALDRLDAARRRVDALVEREKEAHRHLGAARDTVAVQRPPAPGAKSLRADWEVLVQWAVAAAAACRAEQAATEESVAGCAAEAEQLRARAGKLCEPFGLDPTLARLGETFAAAATKFEAAVDAYEEKLSERQETQARLERLEESAAVAGELGQLLSATRFERWLLQEALAELGERASLRLHELSGGQYSLEADDDSFVVRDHRNADERRDVRTLSGGETFLASLSLALALGDGIRDLASASTPQLDSVFLDEGFGTLDPETLDVVAAAIEELGASGRMVGIVTHIRDLADRMPTRFEVHKDDRGSRVERVEL